MSKPLIIIARIQAKKDKVECVRCALSSLIEPTRQEPGCIQYDLHQDNESPEVFIFYERWQSRALWQEHMNSEHLKIYMKETDGAVALFTLNEMSAL